MLSKSFLDLPAEVIDVIVRQIEYGRDRVSFSRACHKFHDSVAKTLWSCMDVEFEASSSLSNSQVSVRVPDGQRSTTIRQLRIDEWTAPMNHDRFDEMPHTERPMDTRCSKSDCRACTLQRTFGALDAFIASNMHRMSTRSQSLKFQGSFGERSKRSNFVPVALEHEIISFGGLSELNLQRFEFEMFWKFWDIAILDVLSTSQLVVLKMPIGGATDVEKLGRALIIMERLESLTVTDMPDNYIFLDNFALLGLGIWSRRPSLKDLDLSVTNFNRPNRYCTTWERVESEDEPFVKPDTFDYFFEKLFPKSPQDVDEGVRKRYLELQSEINIYSNPNGETVRLLRLEKLRLEHIDLPEDTFKRILDGTCLKELRLPFSDVHHAVWPSIESNQIGVLEDINYALLSGTFKTFLHRQKCIQHLSFAKPSGQFREVDVVWFQGDDAPTLCMELVSSAPPLGQGTSWCRASCYASSSEMPRYPTSEMLLNSLSFANITDLHLLADMYDVTPDVVGSIGSLLAHLQNLTWGFDYNNEEIREAFVKSFLPNIPNLHKMTFLSLHLPTGWSGIDSNTMVFDAPLFHRFIASLAGRVPTTLRYLRYRHLVPKDIYGEPRKTTIYYHRQVAERENWWICLHEDVAEEMFEEDRTPHIMD